MISAHAERLMAEAGFGRREAIIRHLADSNACSLWKPFHFTASWEGF